MNKNKYRKEYESLSVEELKAKWKVARDWLMAKKEFDEGFRAGLAKIEVIEDLIREKGGEI